MVLHLVKEALMQTKTPESLKELEQIFEHSEPVRELPSRFPEGIMYIATVMIVITITAAIGGVIAGLLSRV